MKKDQVCSRCLGVPYSETPYRYSETCVQAGCGKILCTSCIDKLIDPELLAQRVHPIVRFYRGLSPVCFKCFRCDAYILICSSHESVTRSDEFQFATLCCSQEACRVETSQCGACHQPTSFETGLEVYSCAIECSKLLKRMFKVHSVELCATCSKLVRAGKLVCHRDGMHATSLLGCDHAEFAPNAGVDVPI